MEAKIILSGNQSCAKGMENVDFGIDCLSWDLGHLNKAS